MNFNHAAGFYKTVETLNHSDPAETLFGIRFSIEFLRSAAQR
jgi:hypothetical protein